MAPEDLKVLSVVFVGGSSLFYYVRVWQRKIKPSLSGWGLWAIIGLALLVTYSDAGDGASTWAAWFGFVNPVLITLMIFVRRDKRVVQTGGLLAWLGFTWLDWLCVVLSMSALAAWLYLKLNFDLERPDMKGVAAWALLLAIAADAVALTPSAKLVWRTPWKDRPTSWTLFAVGYGVTLFAITEHNLANDALPVYALIGGSAIAIPLVVYRLRRMYGDLAYRRNGTRRAKRLRLLDWA